MPICSNAVTIPAWQGVGSIANIHNFAIPTYPLPVSNYLFVTFEVTNTNTLNFAFWSGSVGNTNLPRLPYAYLEDTTGNLIQHGLSYWWGNASAELSGYAQVQITNLATYIGSLAANVTAASITNAAVLPYSTNTSLLSLGSSTDAQTAIDALAYMIATSSVPLLASNTVVVLDGDSKMVGLGSVLTKFPWWNSVAFLTNVAVGGTSLSFTTNAWATNTASFSSRLRNGTNGLYVYWGMHSDMSGNPYNVIGTLSNYLNQVASSNWNIMLLTVQPRASYSQDTPASQLFLPIVNNFIRTWPTPWRVVDAEVLLPNCYNMVFFSDTTHLNPIGYSNIAWGIQPELFAPKKHMWPQEWVYDYGTNIIVAVPGATNGSGSVVATLYRFGGLKLNGGGGE